MAKDYVIAQYEYQDDVEDAYVPYGAIKIFFEYMGQEAMLAGPYDTGKTLGMLQKLNLLMWMYPNVHAILVRKSYKALLPSAIQTLYTKVLPVHPDHPDSLVKIYGGGTPQWLTWPNGSVLKLGGMDEPTKVLSSEYDYIAVPQAEEMNLDDWEQLLSRCNGRAGNVPSPQLMGDCNPDVPLHWIQQRKTLKVFNAQHIDNPTLFMRDEDGELVPDEYGNPTPTEGGKLRIQTLQSMTGLRYKRGYLGLWVGAEGQVYEDFDPSIHVIDGFPIPPDWPRYMSIDFGFTHPFVCQWWTEDEDGRLYMYTEMYHSKRTVREHVEGNPELFQKGIKHFMEEDGGRYDAVICDWDAEDRATLEEYGIKTRSADKRIVVGIEKCQERYRVLDDGRPRIYYFKNALVEEDDELKTAYKPTSTPAEIPGYVWPDIGEKEMAKDERPKKASDHGQDAKRYMVMYKDGKATGKVRVHRYA